MFAISVSSPVPFRPRQGVVGRSMFDVHLFSARCSLVKKNPQAHESPGDLPFPQT